MNSRRTITVLLFAVSAFAVPKKSTAVFDPGTGIYANTELGFTISFDENWRLFTSRSDAPRPLKHQFAPQRGNHAAAQTLFIGATGTGRALVRAVADQTDYQSISMYFRYYYFRNKSDVTSLSARYFQNQERFMVVWDFAYEEEESPSRIRVLAVFTAARNRVLRLEFACSEPLFEDYVDVFHRIAKSLKVAEGPDAGATPWADIAPATGGNIVPYVKCNSVPKPPHSSTDCPEPGRSLLWKVKSATNTVYLLGSIHVGKPELYPLSAAIEEAFDSSRVAVFEVDPCADDFAAKTNKLQQAARYPKGETLRDHISPALFKRVEDMAGFYRVPMGSLVAYKPWWVGGQLAAMHLEYSGLSPRFGIDEHFIAKAYGSKDIVGIETLDEHIRLFDTSSCSDASLFFHLYTADQYISGVSDLLRAWRCGDTAALAPLRVDAVLAKHPELRQTLDQLVLLIWSERGASLICSTRRASAPSSCRVLSATAIEGSEWCCSHC
jgi:uncharacterized protein